MRPTPTPRILVIEDDPSVSTLLAEILGQEGFDVRVAEDGLAGLVKFRSGQPDLAVLDLMMPDVDGVRFLEQVIEEEGAVPVPVVVITGSSDGAARCRALLGGADVFEKPFDPDDLIARIRTHLS